MAIAFVTSRAVSPRLLVEKVTKLFPGIPITRFERVDVIPRNAMGKVVRRRLENDPQAKKDKQD